MPKQITQTVTADGKVAATAVSAPGWFIHNGETLEEFPKLVWGDTFSKPTSGNKVDFFITGQQYFDAVKEAIAKAKHSIYITGWQVNFDVELADDGLTLYEHLRRAMDANKSLHVYVMPWMSPKVGVDTGDFDTMLALAQLNAGVDKATGKNPPPRAFTLLAMEQTDMPGAFAIGFSHHQKLVVIDNEIAFVGGIDLAYGRRDTGGFFLEADGRKGSELYNPCVPKMHQITSVESTSYVYRWELYSACFDGTMSWTGEFVFSAPALPIAYTMDGLSSVNGSVKEGVAGAKNYIGPISLMPEWVKKKQEEIQNWTIKQGKKAYHIADKESGGKLEEGRQQVSTKASDVATATAMFLQGAVLTELPLAIEQAASQQIRSFTLAIQARVQNSADKLDKRYGNLTTRRQLFPAGGSIISVSQPRMPWHDVHCSVKGPSVADLSKNFVDRWNSLAHSYEASNVQQPKDATVQKSLIQMRQTAPAPKIVRLPAAPVKPPTTATVKSWVQVLRSAPVKMLKQEALAQNKKTVDLHRPQNNCLKAMLKAVKSARYFLYIEGQFFQSAYGVEDTRLVTDKFTPIGAMTDATKSPRWKAHMDELGLRGAAQEDMLKKLNFTKIPRVTGDKSFMKDLKFAAKNAAAAKASQSLGAEQKHIINPIGRAVVSRIERAIADGQTFHVYMVLPVHPEGTLETLNIMTQVHYTMQSLVYGVDSLVNGVRRAIAAGMLMREKKGTTMAGALTIVQKYSIEKLNDIVKDRWKQYLTLLNLRNWTMLKDSETGKERPVTEQIYVHSKLLIADDVVAILGSANINDRSQLGDRDSELAIIVRDDVQYVKKIDGKSATPISANVHDLRRRLWYKLFGLTDGARHPANSLRDLIDTPAAPSTWNAIQKVAFDNAVAYQVAFEFVPRVTGEPSSIWPTWNAGEQKLKYYMPFHHLFWRKRTELDKRETDFTWAPAARGPERAPVGIQGFIVALPMSWTAGENNDSKMNRTLLANVELPVTSPVTLEATSGRVLPA